MFQTSFFNVANLGRIIFFLLLLIICNKIKIPLEPIPFTLGTFAVLLIGYLNKPAIAFIICILYLAIGLTGLPVFSGDKSVHLNSFLEMKSAGYILGFIPAVYFISIFRNTSYITLFILGIIGHIIIVTIGYLWLCRFITPFDAFWNGVYPFIPGAIIKTIVAAFLAWAIYKIIITRQSKKISYKDEHS